MRSTGLDLVVLLAEAPFPTAAGARADAPLRVGLLRTEIRSIHSKIVNVDYRLYVSLPRGYDNYSSNQISCVLSELCPFA